MTVRVRIAPSPTGDPHIGTAYIALFNYVFARKHGGKFILRIENTDRERSTLESEAAIIEALKWLGLTWDEGPDVGGPCGPYRQTARLQLYRTHVAHLLHEGKAYRCFCTKERLQGLREAQQEEGSSFIGYDGHCRHLPQEEVQALIRQGSPFTVRCIIPSEGETTFQDGLRPTPITIAHDTLDDFVLQKSDGFPTYHLANVVDDHAMGITHVIRGEEWINSTPKHLLLYKAFDWVPPEFYHLGLLRNPDRSKLSKRKHPVSIFHYRDLGYLPATLLNFMATLGFSFGDNRERFTLQEMIEHFDWSKVHAGGPVFDEVKLDTFSGEDIRGLPLLEFQELVMQRVLHKDRLGPLLREAQPRIHRLDDVIPYITFAFGGNIDYTATKAHLESMGRSLSDQAEVLETFTQEIERDPEARSFTEVALENFTRQFCDCRGWKTKELFPLLRIAVTGRTASPALFTTMEILGKDRCRLRLRSLARFLRG